MPGEPLDRHHIADTKAAEQASGAQRVALEDRFEHEFDLLVRTPVGGDRAFGNVGKAVDRRNPGHVGDERRTLCG